SCGTLAVGWFSRIFCLSSSASLYCTDELLLLLLVSVTFRSMLLLVSGPAGYGWAVSGLAVSGQVGHGLYWAFVGSTTIWYVLFVNCPFSLRTFSTFISPFSCASFMSLNNRCLPIPSSCMIRLVPGQAVTPLPV